MNIVKAFIDYMATLGFGTFGTDLFIGGAPQDAPDACWWAVANGGSPISKSVTGQKMKNYIINVFYRDTDQEIVMNRLEQFETLMNSGNCDEIAGYDKVEISANVFPTDQDLEAQDRTLGLVQVTITVYSN